jgi:hypothetical protein
LTVLNSSLRCLPASTLLNSSHPCFVRFTPTRPLRLFLSLSTLLHKCSPASTLLVSTPTSFACFSPSGPDQLFPTYLVPGSPASHLLACLDCSQLFSPLLRPLHPCLPASPLLTRFTPARPLRLFSTLLSLLHITSKKVGKTLDGNRVTRTVPGTPALVEIGLRQLKLV